MREYFQVKRHSGSLGRAVVDQLRGALPYHKAIRGTVVTLGSFSSGCTEAATFPGAAPITLIDGETLLDLLREHGIGFKKDTLTMYTHDAEQFDREDEDSDAS